MSYIKTYLISKKLNNTFLCGAIKKMTEKRTFYKNKREKIRLIIIVSKKK